MQGKPFKQLSLGRYVEEGFHMHKWVDHFNLVFPFISLCIIHVLLGPYKGKPLEWREVEEPSCAK